MRTLLCKDTIITMKMKMKKASKERDIFLIVGVDPEPNGAIAGIWYNHATGVTEDIVTFATPGLDTNVRKKILLQRILDNKNKKGLFTIHRYAFLEKVWAFPGQNVKSMDHFIRSAGIWEGMLSVYDFEVTTEPAKTWKAFYDLTSNKRDSINIIINNFSKGFISKYFAESGETSSTHGKAEALLMAAYLLKKHWPNAKLNS